jgi:hypothetical protein
MVVVIGASGVFGTGGGIVVSNPFLNVTITVVIVRKNPISEALTAIKETLKTLKTPRVGNSNEFSNIGLHFDKLITTIIAMRKSQ